MIYISKDRQIHVVWSIFRGTSDVHEDFSRALVKVFLIGNYEKYLLEAVAEGGNLVFDIPQGLPEGAYSLEAIWVKNYNNLLPCSDTLTPSVDSGCRNQPLRWPFKHPHDHRFNDRCIMRSRKDYVFALTEYDSESTFYKDSGEAEIKIRSAVATYGYDGLSAYEIAVLRGDFNGTEGEYLDSLKFKLEVAQEHKLGGITAVTKTDDETEEVKVDPETGRLYVKPGGGSLSVATETKLGGIKASSKTDNETVEAKIGEDGKLYVPKGGEELKTATETTLGGIKAATKTSLETQEVKIDPVTGKLYTQSGGEGGVEIVNNPDEEDLHSIEKSADVHVLQFADKEYNASSFSGLGRVYLRKNISDGKNVLTQAMMNKANTRYIIQYDYDLDGETITMPEGCTLDFQGGSLQNGILIGNHTCISASMGVIFHAITVDGTFACANVYLSWFELSESDCLSQLLNCVKLSNGNIFCTVHLNAEISVKLTSSIPFVPVYSHTKITAGIIRLITDNISGTYAIFETRKENDGVLFDNITIYGDGLTNNNNSDVDIQFGHGIRINGGKNITINNCYITECFGDGINIQVGSAGVDDQIPENIKINNCTCNYNRRLGIAVEGGRNIIISNSICKDNGKINNLVFPGSGIDIEPWHNDNYVENLVISGCDLRGNREWSLADYARTEGCSDIIISGSTLDSIMVKNQNSHNTVFNGCDILNGATVSDSIIKFNNCYIANYLALLEENTAPHSVKCEINNSELYFDKEDYSWYNYAPITFRKHNLSQLLDANNKLVIKNSVIKTGTNIDVSKCFRLFAKSIGEGGDAVIELYNTEIVNTKNISITDFVDYFEDCKLNSSQFGIRLAESSKPAVFKRCTFITSTDSIITLGGFSNNYTHKVDPYDIQFLQCSFNPDKIYSDSKSIDTYFDLGYIGGDSDFSILIIDPIFPVGTDYNACNLLMNSYYSIKWLLKDRDFSKTNIDNTLATKVKFSYISNNQENVIYRINEDVDLNGNTKTLGVGCVLDFSAGGKIKNGTLSLNETLLLPLGLNVNECISAVISGTYKEGQILYDPDLKKMKVWNGSIWVNTDGTSL